MENNKRRRRFIGTALQNKTLLLIFIAAVVPAAIVAGCLYYLIFDMLAQQLGIPEAIAYNLIPVARRINLIILIALPVSLFVIWIMALELSHKIAGPIHRLEKELDARINNNKKGPIQLREKDELKSIADKINQLVCK
ncbi:MAG: hypothetical protein HQ547_01000 [Candidatus Omnitrophica bacterium]|nr:hypothetical protein [Candidatus Omnitrophota bacterium]